MVVTSAASTLLASAAWYSLVVRPAKTQRRDEHCRFDSEKRALEAEINRGLKQHGEESKRCHDAERRASTAVHEQELAVRELEQTKRTLEQTVKRVAQLEHYIEQLNTQLDSCTHTMWLLLLCLVVIGFAGAMQAVGNRIAVAWAAYGLVAVVVTLSSEDS
eukprot:SAG31_NODE_6991_length_1825_cov_3.425261_3_plen_161_part_00